MSKQDYILPHISRNFLNKYIKKVNESYCNSFEQIAGDDYFADDRTRHHYIYSVMKQRLTGIFSKAHNEAWEDAKSETEE